jgi:hypothetical protein
MPHLGGEFRFPFTPESFREDSKIDEIASWALVDDDCCARGIRPMLCPHRALPFWRLAVSPRMRGAASARGSSRTPAWGLAEFGDRELSLFVITEQRARVSAVLRLGFRKCPTRGKRSPFMANSRYMIATELRQTP